MTTGPADEATSPPDAEAAPPDDAEQLKEQIEQTRERLGDTVNQLAAKADVKARAQAKTADLTQRAKDKATQLGQQANDTGRQLADKTVAASHQALSAGEAGKDQVQARVSAAGKPVWEATPEPVRRATTTGTTFAARYRVQLAVAAGALIVGYVIIRRVRR